MSGHSTKASPPWIKFSFSDLFGSLKWKRMTLAERGAYITLLGEQALHDNLPADEEDVACVIASSGARISEEDAAEAWSATLRGCFEERDGRLVNPRMASELDEYTSTKSELSAKRSRAGSLGQAKRQQNQANASKATANASKRQLDKIRGEEIRLETPSESPPKPPRGKRAASALIEAEHMRLTIAMVVGTVAWCAMLAVVLLR